MCGICGIVRFTGPPDLDVLRGMMSRLRHRGPDGCGYYRDARAALGHLRLAVIDPETGDQPLANEDGRYWVTFNGEIFNYVELAAELRQLGHCFRTSSDTEVIVHAWEEWGAGGFSRFNGQWAIALWDRLERRLVLSRDRMGIHPLYYCTTADGLRFASEVKSIFADPSVRREFDPAGLAQVFTLWSTVAPRTVFDGVAQVRPGHYLTVEADGRHREMAYWRLTFPPSGAERPGDLRAHVDELRSTLVSATRLRFLRSDVPVVAYLSGGIDSTVITSIIAGSTNAPLTTFSLRFEDDEFDEGAYQRLMVDRLGTEHQEVVARRSQIAEIFPTVVAHAETPLLRSAPAPMYLLSQLVGANGYKVAATGEGADEMLAGYDLFREARVRRFLARDPASSVRRRAVELLYPWMGRSPGRAPAFAHSFFTRNLDLDDPALSHRPRWDATGALMGLLATDLRERMPDDPTRDLVEDLPAGSSEWNPLARDQWLESTSLLAGYLLSSQGDRMLMANSVEGRFPFLDHNLVEFCACLPAEEKLFGLEEKYLLKEAFATDIPEEIRRRPKQPYRAPDATSFVGAATPAWFDDVLAPDAVEAAGVFEHHRAASLVAKCRKAQRPMSNTDNMRLLALVSTQLVHDGLLRSASRETALPPIKVAADLLTEERRAHD